MKIQRYDVHSFDNRLMEEETDDGRFVRCADIAPLLALRDVCGAEGLLDENGKPRTILGTLPVTKDGAIVGYRYGFTSEVFHPDERGPSTCEWLKTWLNANADIAFVTEFVDGMTITRRYVHDCYSTREAAEAAAKESNERD